MPKWAAIAFDGPLSGLGIRYSFGIRPSDFVIPPR
jgi:hypothetical protein